MLKGKIKYLLWLLIGIFMGAYFLYSSLTFVPINKSKMTSVVGILDHYVPDDNEKYPIDEIYLTDGSEYFIETPEYPAFKKESFLKSVKKGQKVELLVDSQSGSKDITMINSGNVTYMSFQAAYNEDRQNNKWGLILGIVMLLLSSIGFVTVIFYKLEDKYHYKRDWR